MLGSREGRFLSWQTQPTGFCKRREKPRGHTCLMPEGRQWAWQLERLFQNNPPREMGSSWCLQDTGTCRVCSGRLHWGGMLSQDLLHVRPPELKIQGEFIIHSFSLCSLLQNPAEYLQDKVNPEGRRKCSICTEEMQHWGITPSVVFKLISY